MTEQPLPYQRAYKQKALDKAYRAVVDGKYSTRDLARLKWAPALRTMDRYSAKDGWIAERDERKALRLKGEREAVEVAAMAAAAASEQEIAAKLEAGADHKTVMMAVLKRQQKLWDTLESKLSEAFASAAEKARETGKPMALGALIPIIKAASMASDGVRKAYGIPDVSKIEWEDTTPAAKRHAETIRQRRLKRMAERAEAAGSSAEALAN